MFLPLVLTLSHLALTTCRIIIIIMSTKLFNQALPVIICQTLFFFIFNVTANSNVQKDHWPALNQVLNEYTWPIRPHVVEAIYEVLSDPQVYKISASCNASLKYFVTGLQENKEDAFRCK